MPGAAIAWLPTLLAKGAGRLRREHLRRQPVQAAEPALHLIVLDRSASMRQNGRLALAKGYAAHLIEQAARAGDDVGVLSFGGRGVELSVPPGPARAAGAMRVRQFDGGGGTPLAQALTLAERLLAAAVMCGQHRTTLWLLTDGRTLERPTRPAADNIVIVDFDHPGRAIGRCAQWAKQWPAEHRSAHDAILR